MRPANTLVDVDERYDSDYASDGASRYGAYLRSREHLFIDDGCPLSAAGFATLAWRIAKSPVMSPGYVQLSSDVYEVDLRPGEDAGDLVAEVEVRLPHPPQARALRSGWRDWSRAMAWASDPGPLVEPDEGRSALLFSARFVVGLHADDLPRPTTLGVDVFLAKLAVARVCELVNLTAGPDLERLLSGWREVRR